MDLSVHPGVPPLPSPHVDQGILHNLQGLLLYLLYVHTPLPIQVGRQLALILTFQIGRSIALISTL